MKIILNVATNLDELISRILFCFFGLFSQKNLNMDSISGSSTNYMSARIIFVTQENVGHRPSRVYTVKTHNVP